MLASHHEDRTPREDPSDQPGRRELIRRRARTDVAEAAPAKASTSTLRVEEDYDADDAYTDSVQCQSAVGTSADARSSTKRSQLRRKSSQRDNEDRGRRSRREVDRSQRGGCIAGRPGSRDNTAAASAVGSRDDTAAVSAVENEPFLAPRPIDEKRCSVVKVSDAASSAPDCRRPQGATEDTTGRSTNHESTAGRSNYDSRSIAGASKSGFHVSRRLRSVGPLAGRPGCSTLRSGQLPRALPSCADATRTISADAFTSSQGRLPHQLSAPRPALARKSRRQEAPEQQSQQGMVEGTGGRKARASKRGRRIDDASAAPRQASWQRHRSSSRPHSVVPKTP